MDSLGVPVVEHGVFPAFSPYIDRRDEVNGTTPATITTSQSRGEFAGSGRALRHAAADRLRSCPDLSEGRVTVILCARPRGGMGGADDEGTGLAGAEDGVGNLCS